MNAKIKEMGSISGGGWRCGCGDSKAEKLRRNPDWYTSVPKGQEEPIRKTKKEQPCKQQNKEGRMRRESQGVSSQHQTLQRGGVKRNHEKWLTRMQRLKTQVGFVFFFWFWFNYIIQLHNSPFYFFKQSDFCSELLNRLRKAFCFHI